ncbi:MAG: T9SS type A sorting domain-containing protein, partial [Saprospiraceae bacterium]|nr:T9SS type A sorting domain-containing protein [Saprospiraceae bacterium]
TFEAEAPIEKIVVFDGLGRQVLFVTGNGEKQVLDISGLKQGLYVYTLQSGKKQIAGRFLVKH